MAGSTHPSAAQQHSTDAQQTQDVEEACPRFHSWSMEAMLPHSGGDLESLGSDASFSGSPPYTPPRNRRLRTVRRVDADPHTGDALTPRSEGSCSSEDTRRISPLRGTRFKSMKRLLDASPSRMSPALRQGSVSPARLSPQRQGSLSPT